MNKTPSGPATSGSAEGDTLVFLRAADGDSILMVSRGEFLGLPCGPMPAFMTVNEFAWDVLNRYAILEMGWPHPEDGLGEGVKVFESLEFPWAGRLVHAAIYCFPQAKIKAAPIRADAYMVGPACESHPGLKLDITTALGTMPEPERQTAFRHLVAA